MTQDLLSYYKNELQSIDYKKFEDKVEKAKTPNVNKLDSKIEMHFNSQVQIYRNIQNPKFTDKKASNIAKFTDNWLSY